MALGTPRLLGSFTRNTTANTAFDITLTQAIEANALAFVVVHLNRNGASPTTPSVPSGGGVTWAAHQSFVYDASGYQAGFFVFRAQGGSPSGTTITVTPPAISALINTQAVVVEFPNATVGATSADAIIQTVTADTGGKSSGSLAAASMATLSNTTENGFFVIVGGTLTSASITFNGGTSPVITELYDNVQLNTGNGIGMFLGYALAVSATNPSVGASPSGASLNDSGVIGIEVAGAATPNTVRREMFRMRKSLAVRTYF